MGVNENSAGPMEKQDILVAVDAPRMGAARDKKNRILEAFPLSKKQFVVKAHDGRTSSVAGPVQCMWIAKYDFAPQVNPPEFYWSSRAAECYAWFGLTLYLQIHGQQPADWSSGGSREPGQAFQDVVISRRQPYEFRSDPFVP